MHELTISRGTRNDFRSVTFLFFFFLFSFLIGQQSVDWEGKSWPMKRKRKRERKGLPLSCRYIFF
jgi:hypothetical protein